MFYIGKNKNPPPFPKDLSKECEDFLLWCFKLIYTFCDLNLEKIHPKGKTFTNLECIDL